jgi:hypothetical protein
MKECVMCKKLFRNNYDLTRHQSRKTPCGEEKITEHPANSGILNPNSGIDHSNSGILNPNSGINSPNSGIICKYCQKTFSTKENLKKHTEKCKEYNETRLLEIELNIHPEIPTCNTECRFCKKKLFRSDSLKSHLSICKEKEEYHDKLTKQKEMIHTNEVSQMIINNNNNNQINNGKIINNNQSLNIYFNENTIPFGNKRLTDHIKVEKLVEILRASYKQYEPGQDYEVAGEILSRLEEYLQEIPENRNYQIDRKSPIWTIKTDGGVKAIDKDKCLHSIVKENAGILCDKKDEIDKCNGGLFKNKTLAGAFIHERTFSRRGINHKPYGERKMNVIKNAIQIANI